MPAAVEMMDRLTIDAAEAAVHPELSEDRRRAHRRARRPGSRKWTSCSPSSSRCAATCGAITMEVAKDQAQRERIWKGRKAAFAAMGRVSPNYYVQDGVVPRTKLPEVLRRIRELEARSGLRIGNVFHAGDGNLHPLICYDEADSRPGRARRSRSRPKSCSTASKPAARSPASTASAPTRRRTCRRCSPPTTSTRCSSCAARSIPPASAIPARSFRRRGCAARCPGPYRQHPLERAGWRSDSDGAADVLEPADAAGVAAKLKWAERAKAWRSSIRGAGTKQSLGRAGLADRRRALDARPERARSTTSPAISWPRFRPARRSTPSTTCCGARRQWLPLDPPRVAAARPSAASSPPTTAARGATGTARRAI